jgi:arylsulfatase A-like enzyme
MCPDQNYTLTLKDKKIIVNTMRIIRTPIYLIAALLFSQSAAGQIAAPAKNKRPNILFCIADDASFQHMSAYGFGLTKWVNTPGFDRVAKEGLLFTRAYTPTAKCAPSRASILTGRNPWQMKEAGNHNPIYPADLSTFVEVLGKNGYATGFTGKGWGPGNAGKTNGRPRQLTGPEYNQIKTKALTKAMSGTDYTANFKAFLNDKPAEQPFFFWYGSHEPHRGYAYGSGVALGKKNTKDIDQVPPFWIDNETVRNDMLDYALELEYYDQQLLSILKTLEDAGELDNTLIIVTSDNGMPFPRVKGHLYDYDNHLPLAMMWKNNIASPGRKINDFVSFIDFAPTILDVAQVEPKGKMQPIQGSSLLNIFRSPAAKDNNRERVILGREREDVGRPNDEGYPVRAIVKGNFFYAVNYEPSRWPSGNPETGYADTDGGPTKTELLQANRKGQHKDLWQLSFGIKGSEELYQTDKDPYSMNNLAADPAFAAIKARLRKEMEAELKKQGDPRMFGKGYLFDQYPYAQEGVRNFYERYKKGEKMSTGWLNDTDFEKPDFKQ